MWNSSSTSASPSSTAIFRSSWHTAIGVLSKLSKWRSLLRRHTSPVDSPAAPLERHARRPYTFKTPLRQRRKARTQTNWRQEAVNDQILVPSSSKAKQLPTLNIHLRVGGVEKPNGKACVDHHSRLACFPNQSSQLPGALDDTNVSTVNGGTCFAPGLKFILEFINSVCVCVRACVCARWTPASCHQIRQSFCMVAAHAVKCPSVASLLRLRNRTKH